MQGGDIVTGGAGLAGYSSMGHYIDLIAYKSWAQLRVEATRGYLGIVWWVIEPLLYIAVFYVIFGILFQRGGEGYVAFLMTGLVAWRWFDNTVRVGANSVVDNIGLMRRVYVPKLVFPSAVVVSNSVKFLFVLTILLLFLLLYGVNPGPSWLALPVLLAIQLLLITAVTWVVSAVIPFFPDFRVMIDSGLTLLFFLSGIFFDLGSVTGSIADILRMNPMAILIESYRHALIQGVWPDWLTLGGLLLFCIMLLILGWRLHMRFDRQFVKNGFV